MGVREACVQGRKERNMAGSEVRGAASEPLCDGGSHVAEPRGEDHTQDGGAHQVLPLPRHHRAAPRALPQPRQPDRDHLRKHALRLGHHHE